MFLELVKIIGSILPFFKTASLAIPFLMEMFLGGKNIRTKQKIKDFNKNRVIRKVVLIALLLITSTVPFLIERLFKLSRENMELKAILLKKKPDPPKVVNCGSDRSDPPPAPPRKNDVGQAKKNRSNKDNAVDLLKKAGS